MRNRKTALLAAILVGGLAIGLVASSFGRDAGGEQVPPLSSSKESTVNFAPGETFAVFGPDGKPIVCEDGKDLRIDPVTDNPPPNLSESKPTDDPSVDEITEGVVPRCAASGSANRVAWIPEDLAEEYPATAPARFSK